MRHMSHEHRSGGRGGFRGGGRPGGKRGGRRMFEGGELRLVLLALIKDEPRHGYDLIREIEQMTAGAYAPSPGAVYPTISYLIDMGFAEERAEEGPRKRFFATESGRKHLEERKDEVGHVLERLRGLGEMTERTDAPPVRRAMDNLKTSIHNRLSAEGADRQTQFDVAALIDEAAGKIERC